LKMLQQQVAETFFKDVSKALNDMSPEQMQALQQMMRDLNDMLERSMRSEDPDFEEFMDRYG